MGVKLREPESPSEMGKIIVSGGKPLNGEVEISPSKNGILPVIAASLLAEGPTSIPVIPNLTDVDTICEVISSLGVKVNRQPPGLAISGGQVNSVEPPYELVRKMRASILVMGPLLARQGRAVISLPGGCAIGSRPIDLHLKGLAAMGARITLGAGKIEARAPTLRGSRIYLDFPSVGATENLMMAASLAQGITYIENAALEPEIVNLADFINDMGGRVEGAGTNVIRITGVRELHGVVRSVIPDRIEAGTYMVAAAATGGSITLKNVRPEHLQSIIFKLRETGTEIQEEGEGSLRVTGSSSLQPVHLKTMPYPGFPTDMQPQFVALLSRAGGTSIVIETIFENRYLHVNELVRMGARIKTEGRTAIVDGVPALTGTRVRATDLRAGAALVIAALSATGDTEISGSEHVDRGYENLVDKLIGLGAAIKREP